jgi:hypothetical protein
MHAEELTKLKDTALRYKAECDRFVIEEEELQAFPLPPYAAADCCLSLGTPHTFLPLALRWAEHWGFRYQSRSD